MLFSIHRKQSGYRGGGEEDLADPRSRGLACSKKSTLELLPSNFMMAKPLNSRINIIIMPLA